MSKPKTNFTFGGNSMGNFLTSIAFIALVLWVIWSIYTVIVAPKHNKSRKNVGSNNLKICIILFFIFIIILAINGSSSLGEFLFGITFFILLFWIIWSIYTVIVAPKHNQSRKRIGLKNLGIFVIIFILETIFAGLSDNKKETSNPTHQVTTNHNSKNTNIPGYKLTKSQVDKHDFYYTSKEYSNIRYFINDSNKITAIKIVFQPDAQSTASAQSFVEKALHDKNLKYTNDKENSDNTYLANDESYNVYSPKYKKWFWIRMDQYRDTDDKVVSVAIYPGKSDEAN